MGKLKEEINVLRKDMRASVELQKELREELSLLRKQDSGISESNGNLKEKDVTVSKPDEISVETVSSQFNHVPVSNMLCAILQCIIVC